jgi:antitoxin (DNA-binding transcriptional repressor) of toxin-antitoxin stability system
MGWYLREVKSGGSLAVTERSEHIATLSPKAKAEKEETFDELLDQLV